MRRTVRSVTFLRLSYWHSRRIADIQPFVAVSLHDRQCVNRVSHHYPISYPSIWERTWPLSHYMVKCQTSGFPRLVNHVVGAYPIGVIFPQHRAALAAPPAAINGDMSLFQLFLARFQQIFFTVYFVTISTENSICFRPKFGILHPYGKNSWIAAVIGLFRHVTCWATLPLVVSRLTYFVGPLLLSFVKRRALSNCHPCLHICHV